MIDGAVCAVCAIIIVSIYSFDSCLCFGEIIRTETGITGQANTSLCKYKHRQRASSWKHSLQISRLGHGSGLSYFFGMTTPGVLDQLLDILTRGILVLRMQGHRECVGGWPEGKWEAAAITGLG